MDNLNFDGIFITLGTDYEKKFAWCVRYVNNIKCICLYNRSDDGLSTYSESDYITAIPVDKLIPQINKLK